MNTDQWILYNTKSFDLDTVCLLLDNMSADFPSSNPFRRKQPSSTFPPAPPESPPISNHIAYQQAEPLASTTNLPKLDTPKKAAKKVRVQSPPPPSPSLPDSSSTIGEDAYSIPAKPPTPIPRDDPDYDPFGSTTSDASEDEENKKPTQAPINPFSRTLETMENPGREEPVMLSTNITSPGRASLDVEAFKRLLMTGNAGLGTSTTPPTSQSQVAHHALGDGGSSTDTSSLSRQSIFEPIQEPHPESPRTSHEISEPEDDRRGLSADIPSSTLGRKKPPPPSSRHGKLIKVELRDDPVTVALQSPTTPGSVTSQQYFSSSPRSLTDLNKPLPLPPSRVSHDSDRESVFDKEAAGKTPEPPSPSASIRKKTPPAPPLTRRHSQLVSDSKITRSETGRLSPKAEEDNISISTIDSGRPRSDSARAPPPPPSRRPASIRGSSHHVPLSSPPGAATSAPVPPPARGSSRSISGRPPSVSSMDMSTTTNKRASVLPPPPPPPRHGRNSMEGVSQSPGASRRASGEQSRRSMDSTRRESVASSIISPRIEKVQSNASTSGGQDILADLSALQREIDALRVQSEKESVT